MSDIDYKKIAMYGMPVVLAVGVAVGVFVIAPMLEEKKTNPADKKPKSTGK